MKPDDRSKSNLARSTPRADVLRKMKEKKSNRIKNTLQLIGKYSEELSLIDETKDISNFKVYASYANRLLIPFNDKFIKNKYLRHSSNLGIKKTDNFYSRMEKDTVQRLKRKQMLSRFSKSPEKHGNLDFEDFNLILKLYL